MDPSKFQNSSAGRCLKQPNGYWAYIPNSLPPVLEADWEIAGLLAEANNRVGELSGVGRHLANPHLLIQPYIRREAVLSSRIENTQAGMDDLFFFEADETEKPTVPDVKEVANYVRAMEHGLGRLSELPLSGRLIREIHEILMSGVRGDHATPGEFRRSQNWIGPSGCMLMDATFVPPPPAEMLEALTQWERYINGDPREPVLIQCALMHYQFEAIHPFIDGNGRIGRLLITFLLCQRELLSLPLLYISAFFEKYRDEYYRRLLAVSQGGDWKGWIEYFLRGVSVQAKEACDNAKAILDLNKQIHDQVRDKGRSPRHTQQVVDQLFKNPVISVTRLANELNIRFQSAQRCVEFMCKHGILTELTGQRRNRLFVAPQMIEILAGSEYRSR